MGEVLESMEGLTPCPAEQSTTSLHGLGLEGLLVPWSQVSCPSELSDPVAATWL